MLEGAERAWARDVGGTLLGEAESSVMTAPFKYSWQTNA